MNATIATELRSSVQPRDSATQPFRIALHDMGTSIRHNWVTHVEVVTEVENVAPEYRDNLSSDGKFCSKHPREDYNWGNYHGSDYDKALADYRERCDKYKLA